MKLGAVRRASSFPDSHVGEEVVPGHVLIEKIARGGSGEVWAAEGPGGFPTALKFIRLPDGPSAVDLRALEILRSVRHPNVLTTFGSFLKDDWLILAMERADGSLWDRYVAATAEGLPGIARDDLIEWLTEAAQGIDYLNQARHANGARAGLGIQHRDIKPQNILLVGGGVKVGDFGTARWMEEAVGGFTGQGYTLDYAAPEFFQGMTSRHSDQYGLAVSFCRLRGGRAPFSGSAAAITAGHLMHAPDLSMIDEVERPAIARALAKDPEARWESCRAFLDALRSDIHQADRLQSRLPEEVRPEIATAAIEQATEDLPPPLEPAEPASGPEIPTASCLPTPVVNEAIETPRIRDDPEETGWTPSLATNGHPWVQTPMRLRPVLAAVVLVGLGGLVVWGGFLDFHVPEATAAPRPAPVRVPLVSPAIRAREERPGPRPVASPAPEIVKRIETPREVRSSPPSRLAILPAWKSIVRAFALAPARLQQGWEGLSASAASRMANLPSRPEAVTATAPPPVPRTLGDAHLAKGEFDLAIAAYREAIGRDASDVASAQGLARALSATGDLDGAISAWDQAIRREPANAQAYKARAEARQRKGDRAGAIADYAEALRLRPNDAGTLNRRGLLLVGQGQPYKAIADFDEAISLNPSDAAFHYNRGFVYDRLGDTVEALTEYDRAIRLDPGLAPAYRARAAAHARRGDVSRAKADQDQAARLDGAASTPPHTPPAATPPSSPATSTPSRTRLGSGDAKAPSRTGSNGSNPSPSARR